MTKQFQDEKGKTLILPYIAQGDKYDKTEFTFTSNCKVPSLDCMKKDLKDFRKSSPCQNIALMVSKGLETLPASWLWLHHHPHELGNGTGALLCKTHVLPSLQKTFTLTGTYTPWPQLHQDLQLTEFTLLIFCSDWSISSGIYSWQTEVLY